MAKKTTNKFKGFPKVLLIDDSEEFYNLVKSKMKAEGIILSWAKSIDEATSILEEKNVELIVLDKNLKAGESTGIDGLIKIKENKLTKDIPIILVTGDTDYDSRVSAFHFGAVDFIGKPIAMEEFFQRCLIQLELNQRRQLEYERNLVKNDLLHLLSHELINPISSGQSLFEMIKEDPKNLENFGPIIEETFQQALSLIDLSRKMLATDDSINFELEYCSLSDAIDQVQILVQDSLILKNITLEKKIEDDFEVLADWGALLESVLKNIVVNAIKFSFEGSKIEISATKTKNEMIKISVRDFGIGVPEKMLPNLFEVSKATKRKGTKGEMGDGFGLAFARKILWGFNGTIEIKSQTKEANPENPGTTVNIFLLGRVKES